MSEAARGSVLHVLRTRFLVGGALVAAVVGVVLLDATLLPVLPTAAVIVALGLCAQVELYAMMRRAGLPVATGIGLLAGAFVFLARLLPALGVGAASDAGLELAFAAAGVLAWGVLRGRTANAHVEVATTILGIVFVPFLLGYAIDLRLASPRGGLGLLVFLVAVAKTCDSFAYFGGISLGRRPLAPAVSPKKTWEGAFAGLLGAVLLAGILGATDAAGGLGLTEAIGAGILVAVAATFADLAESLLKRACGAKDSAATLPVLGGTLDLVDSLLFAAPALRAYVAWVASPISPP